MAPAKKASSDSTAAAPAAVKKTEKKPTKKTKEGPKRPMSAFFWFLQKRRPQFIIENPELKTDVKEVGKRLGDEWKNMDDAAKAPYMKMNEDDKKRYESEKAKSGGSK